ncbi:MAG: hypothetical protein P8Y45_24430, partial [Exilibacterium sp.]
MKKSLFTMALIASKSFPRYSVTFDEIGGGQFVAELPSVGFIGVNHFQVENPQSSRGRLLVDGSSGGLDDEGRSVASNASTFCA